MIVIDDPYRPRPVTPADLRWTRAKWTRDRKRWNRERRTRLVVVRVERMDAADRQRFLDALGVLSASATSLVIVSPTETFRRRAFPSWRERVETLRNERIVAWWRQRQP